MPPELDSFDNNSQHPLSEESDPDTSMQIAKLNASTPKTSREPSQFIERLQKLPELRELPWKEGKELTVEELAKQYTRIQSRAGYLLATRGTVRNPPCNRCAKGSGRFSVCVSLNDWFKGACATCEMATRGRQCSLRKELEARGTAKPPKSASSKPALEELESPVSDHAEPVSLKRKRDTPATLDGPQAHVRPYQGDAQWPRNSATAYSPAANHAATPQQAVPVESRPPLLEYVYQKQHPPNGNKRHHLMYRAQRDSQEPASASSLRNGYSTSSNTRALASGSSEDRGEDAQSPGVQVQQPQSQNVWHGGHRKNPIGASALRSGGGDVLEAPLIDTLPRKKQKQIFGIIGGIQSGIRTVRQQTEDLQRQLDLLQAAFGIGSDGDEDA